VGGSTKEELKKVQEKRKTQYPPLHRDYQKAADLKVRECKLLQEIRSLRKEQGRHTHSRGNCVCNRILDKDTCTEADREEAEKLMNLGERLHKGSSASNEAVVRF
jgi:ATP-dependent Clp protease ATP-binding subunit ClpE